MTAELHRTALKRWTALLSIALSAHAFGAISVTPVADVVLGPWNPAQGDLTGTGSFCVRSVLGNGTTPRDYRVRITPLTSTLFELVSIADPALRIPFQMHFDDLNTPASEQLVEDVWSSREMDPEISCNPIQLNAQVRVELSSVALAAAPAGIYQASFNFAAGSSGNAQDVFVVRLNVSEMAWIQNLDPVALSYSMGSDALGDEPFCIWTSTGAYDITVNSRTPTGSTSFLATGQSLPANTVTYSVLFDADPDASDGSTVTEGAVLANQPTTATGIPPSCMADNAALRITFAESGNLDAAPADTYQDELTLLVEPR